MKRLMQFGLLLAAVVGMLAVAGCRLFSGAEVAKPEAVSALKVPAGCKAKPGTAAEPYTRTGWAKEIIHEKTGIELVYIPAGTFMMGSPADEVGRDDNEVQHRVTISKGFYMGKYEVTQAQWGEVMGNNPSEFKSATLPVETVSWDDCQNFCGKTGLRLPTEAQWEYACRAGTIGAYGGTGGLDEMGWYYENSGSDRLLDASWDDSKLISNHCQTHPVGQKQPNSWGVYDMHGNVWEWCSDLYDDYPVRDDSDPTGAATGPFRVIRGGCWNINAWICRSAFRSMLVPNIQNSLLGLRVVLPAVQ